MGADGVLVGLEFVVGLHSWVADCRGGRQVMLLSALVRSKDGSLLSIVEHEKLLLLLVRSLRVDGD